MSIIHLLTKTVIVSRLVTVSGYKKAYSTVTGVLVNLQPIAPDKISLYEGKVGKTHLLFADGLVDLQEGDKLRDSSTGKLYKIRTGGVSRRTQGSIDYLHVVVEEIS